jgi:hypothetical protein
VSSITTFSNSKQVKFYHYLKGEALGNFIHVLESYQKLDYIYTTMKIKFLFLLSTLLISMFTYAEQAAQVKASSDSAFPSVADNIQAMDQDHDGIITAEEISQYLQSQRGRGYKQGVLDELQRVSNNRSCGSPFSRSVY